MRLFQRYLVPLICLLLLPLLCESHMGFVQPPGRTDGRGCASTIACPCFFPLIFRSQSVSVRRHCFFLIATSYNTFAWFESFCDSFPVFIDLQGPTTLIVEETINHLGAPFRIALSPVDDSRFNEFILLDMVPHNDQGGAPKRYAFEVSRVLMISSSHLRWLFLT